MSTSELYITLLIFVKEGEEDAFLQYEEKVLPLLAQYNGQLLYRIRPDRSNVVNPIEEHPYEIHLISFATREDFDRYKQDKARKACSHLFQQSVKNILLIEGQKK